MKRTFSRHPLVL